MKQEPRAFAYQPPVEINVYVGGQWHTMGLDEARALRKEVTNAVKKANAFNRARNAVYREMNKR